MVAHPRPQRSVIVFSLKKPVTPLQWGQNTGRENQVGWGGFRRGRLAHKDRRSGREPEDTKSDIRGKTSLETSR